MNPVTRPDRAPRPADRVDVSLLPAAGDQPGRVARVAGRIVGCVRVRRYGADTGEFGLLASDPAYRGVGVGRELVRFAERTCRADGLRVMRLDVLVPRHRPDPGKQSLFAWYGRMGYRLARTRTLEEAYPDLVPLLAVPAELVSYRKDLAP